MGFISDAKNTGWHCRDCRMLLLDHDKLVR
jgi:hypothetical protein